MNHADEPRSDDELELLFERWLDDPGSLTASDLARLEAEPWLRERLQALRDVEGELRVAAEDWRAKALDREPPPAPALEAALRARFEDLAASGSEVGDAPRSGEVWRTVLWSALAAVAAGLFVWLWPRDEVPRPAPHGPPEFLGPGDRDLGVEVDPATARLTWTRPVRADETVILTVVDPASGETIHTVRVRGEQSFDPGEELLRGWPERFEMAIEVRDVDGERVAGPVRVEVRRPRRIGRAAREPPEPAAAAPDGRLADLGRAAAEARAAGDVDWALCLDVERVTVLAAHERFESAERLLADLQAQVATSEPAAAPSGAVLLALAEVELALQDHDPDRAAAALEQAAGRLVVVEREYGAEERQVLEVQVGLARSRSELVRGRGDLAVRAASGALQRAEALGMHPEARRSVRAAQVELARAALAARQADRTLELVDRLLDVAGPYGSDAAEPLILRAKLRGMTVGASPESIDAARRDLDAALGLDGVSPRLRFAGLVQLAAILWNGGRTAEAASAVSRAESALAGLLGDDPTGAPPPGAVLLLRAVDARLRLATARGPAAEELARRLGHALLDTVFVADEVESGRPIGAPLLDVGRRAAVTAWLDCLRATAPGPTGDRAAFEALCRTQAVGHLARWWGETAPSLDTVRALLLPPSGAETDPELWTWSFGWRISHLFVVGRDRITCHVLPHGEEALRSAVSRFRDAPADVDAARRLGAMLVPPEVLRGGVSDGSRALTLVGLRDLGGVPAAALRIGTEAGGRAGAGSGERLGARYAITHLPSVPVGVALARREARRVAASPTTQVVLLGGPRRGSDGFDLDAAMLRDLLPVEASLAAVCTGSEARLDRLRAPDVAPATALVVVAHGARDPETGATNVLLAGEDPAAELTPRWLDRLAPAPDAAPSLPPLCLALVCGAARQRLLRGQDGAQGLAGALLRAGARVVLVAQDEVEFATARRFARAFGERLVAGATPARALPAALAALEDDPDRVAERLGGVHLVGLAHRPLWSAVEPGGARSARLPLALLAAAVAAMLAGCVSRSRRRGPGWAAVRAAAGGG